MPSTGTLLVRVYSSAAQLPIQGACVRVLAKTATGQRVLAVRTTDSSGLIEPVTLEAVGSSHIRVAMKNGGTNRRFSCLADIAQ